jgi:hypothetical protein
MTASSRADVESSGVVIPFRKAASSADATTAPINWAELLNSPDAASSLKALIEGAVLNAYVRTQLSAPAPVADNPFDAIYISELRPDLIANSDRSLVRLHHNIHDLSSSIIFADGWDD